MAVSATIRSNLYKDSVALMRVAQRLLEDAEVTRATLVMGTPANKAMLVESQLMHEALANATPSDLMIVVEAVSDAAIERAEHAITHLLNEAPTAASATTSAPATSIAMAVERGATAVIAQISVPGAYAGAEALKALRRGMHVFIFSDNVPLDEERELKRVAVQKGLLVMGPDCGTAFVRGVPLGFANVVPRGAIGLVGASGTGMQEVMCRIDSLGQGVSHAIGTGSRDVHEAIGGATMCQAIDLLAADPATQVITLVSKPPAQSVADRVLQRIAAASKPSVVLFLGETMASRSWPSNATAVATLADAARASVAALVGDRAKDGLDERVDDAFVERTARALAPSQRFVHGLYSGGTFCIEAQTLWLPLGLDVASNAPLHPQREGGATHSGGHRATDFGADEFTVGRPHPMIDVTTRVEQLAREGRDPSVAVVVLDVVLGYGSHPDPAGALAPAIANARAVARRDGRDLVVIAFVTGTERDPQPLSSQQSALRDAGAIVVDDSTKAAQLAGAIAVRANAPTRSATWVERH